MKVLKHVQSGVSQRFDNHIKNFEKFEQHISNHFNKNSAAAGGGGGELTVADSTNPDNALRRY